MRRVCVSSSQGKGKRFAHSLFFLPFYASLLFFFFLPPFHASLNLFYWKKLLNPLLFLLFSFLVQLAKNSVEKQGSNFVGFPTPAFKWVCILSWDTYRYLRNYWPVWTMTRFYWIFFSLDKWEPKLLQRPLSTPGSPREILVLLHLFLNWVLQILHFFFFCKLQVWGTPAPSWSISATFNSVCSLRVSASHLGNSCNISLLLLLYLL